MIRQVDRFFESRLCKGLRHRTASKLICATLPSLLFWEDLLTADLCVFSINQRTNEIPFTVDLFPAPIARKAGEQRGNWSILGIVH